VRACWAFVAVVPVGWRDSSEYSAEFLPDRKKPDRYYAEVKFDNRLTKALDSMTASWTWRGGAAFTVSELESLKHTSVDDIHDMGREYGAIRANGEFESLSLILEIPSQFAPKPDTVQVYVEEYLGPNASASLAAFHGVNSIVAILWPRLH